jgi:hypothetical protein
VRLARRDLVWINVTPHPTADWIARQITEAFPAIYYNEVRTHVSLGKDAPRSRPIERFGETLLPIRFLAGFTIDTQESSFRKRHQALILHPHHSLLQRPW